MGKEIQWIKKDEESFKKFEAAFLPKIGKSTSFGGFMKKVKTTQDVVLKKKKRIKVGKRGKQNVIAEWVDLELIDNINLRSKLSRRWRLARKQNKPEEVLKAYKEEYEKQQRKTSIMSGKKKRRMGSKQNRRNLEKREKILEHDQRVIRKQQKEG